jgi:hypothetical protein
MCGYSNLVCLHKVKRKQETTAQELRLTKLVKYYHIKICCIDSKVLTAGDGFAVTFSDITVVALTEKQVTI